MAHLLPYSVSGDFLNGGTSVEYRPGYWFVERAGIGVPLSPIIWQSGQGGRMLVAAGIALLLHFDSRGAARNCRSARGSPRPGRRLRDGSGGSIQPGAEVAAYLLGGQVAAVGRRRRPSSRRATRCMRGRSSSASPTSTA
jgi:hypothetical protein